MALVGITLVLAGCSATGASRSAATGGAQARAATTSTTAAPHALPASKPLIMGLVDKGSEQPYHLSQPFPVTDTAEVATDPDGFAGIVVNETWAQLEPTEGQVDVAPLDASLAAVTAYNATPGHPPLAVKLRIWGGFTAPSWAKALDGAPIVVPSTAKEEGGTLGRWWESDYEGQWSEFQRALASRYDSNPLIREVAVTSCATATAEPFIITAAIVRAAQSAGWTSAAQQQCLTAALGEYSPWHRTAIDFTFNSFAQVSSTGHVTSDFAVTSGLMAACADAAPPAPSCVLDNHGLTDSVLPQQQDLYTEIDTLWSQRPASTPVAFQTLKPNGFDLCAAVGVGIAHHAQSIEIWPGGAGFPGFAMYTPTQLAAWNSALAVGRSPSCG